MKRIVCVGDALTLGVRTTRGYPEHLWELLHLGGEGAPALNVLVQNAGLQVGSSLVDVVRALPTHLSGRVHAAVLLAPPYDARGGGTPPREFRALLEQAVVTMRALVLPDEGRVVLATPTPIGATTVRGFARPSRRWIAKAAEVVLEVGREHEVPVVALHEMPSEHLADGVHLKPAGYRWVAEQVAVEVRAALR